MAYKIVKRQITLDDFFKLKKYSPFTYLRFIGKQVNLSSLFGSQGPTVGRQLKKAGFTEKNADEAIQSLGLKEALKVAKQTNKRNLSETDLKFNIVGNKLRELFFQAYPGLLRRIEREQNFALKKGYVRTWTGPVRHFPEVKYLNINKRGMLEGLDQKLYSKMLASIKNEASNTAIQTAEVYQAMPNATAIMTLLKQWSFKSYLFSAVHDSFVLYIYKPERNVVYALLNKLALEHREPYFGLRMYIDIIESDLDNPDHYYDHGNEVFLDDFDIDIELEKWNKEHNTDLKYECLIPR